jgi:hypothetical protein
VHARSRATRFLLQINLLRAQEMRREASRVSFLMCPFCVRAQMPIKATLLRAARMFVITRTRSLRRRGRVDGRAATRATMLLPSD